MRTGTPAASAQEAAAWADRILHATTRGGQDTPAADTPAGGLWLYTTIQQANRQQAAGQLDQAGQTYRHALAYLQDQPETDWTRTNISAIYYQLGMTAQDRGRLDEADDWYRQALTINEELGDRPSMASTYHQLGSDRPGPRAAGRGRRLVPQSPHHQRRTRQPARHGDHLPPARHTPP